MNYRIYTRIVLVASLVIITVAGFGCKGLSSEQQAAVRPITLEYWTVHHDVAQLRRFAEEYKQLRPYVSVNIRQVRAEEFDRLFTNALADDVGPDIVSIHARSVRQNQARLSPMPSTVRVARIFQRGQYSQQQEVVIDTIAMPRERDIRNEYVRTVYDDVVVGGEIYGLPLAFDALALFYNQTILDRAGIAEPPRDWDQFVTAVRAITRFNSIGDIVQSGVPLGTSVNIENHFDIVSLFMLQSGVRLASGNTVLFAQGVERSPDRSHPVLRALDFYTDFARPTKQSYSWNERMGSAFDEFVRGRTGFFIGFAYEYPRIKALAPQLDIRVTTIPQLDQGNPSNIANYWIESVVKKSRHQNEAWDFVRFITSKDKVRTYTANTFRPSPYREHIALQQEDEEMGPFATQALYAENWYRGNTPDTAIRAFGDMITEYLRAGNTEQETLRKDRELLTNTAARIQQTY